MKAKVNLTPVYQKGRTGQSGTAQPKVKAESITRISKLMALAIRFERMMARGEVANTIELAKLCHVTQARVSQILALAMLAPEIQEELMFLPCPSKGGRRLFEKMMRPIAAELDWERQRMMWATLKS